MFFRIWFSSFSVYCLFLIPLSWLYIFVNMCNRVSYQWGWRTIYKFSVPIIVIGNLTIGGNGKTPMVLWLIDQLQIRGWKVGVVSRGYRGKSDTYPIIINQLSHSSECGDEPMLIWKRTKGIVPIAVAPNRVKAVSALLKNYRLDIVISDDGLQHYSMFRNIEWVIINNSVRFGNGYQLPAGPMREHMNRLSKVQEIIVNGSNNNVLKFGEIFMQLYPKTVINLLTGEGRSLQSFKNVVAMAGIGFPNHFFDTLRNHGIKLIQTISFSDHHQYSEDMLIDLANPNEILLMTEKDAIKCFDFAHKNWWYVHIDVKINQLNTERLLYNVENVIRNHNKL